MNKEITTEDIIKAIDEMFDEEKVQENETFWRGYNYGITRVQQYIVKLNQELQRKDNNWNELKKWVIEKVKIRCDDCFCMNEVLNKIKEVENDN